MPRETGFGRIYYDILHSCYILSLGQIIICVCVLWLLDHLKDSCYWAAIENSLCRAPCGAVLGFQSPPSRLVALVSGHHTMAATFSGCATSLGEGRCGDGLRGSVGVGMGFRVRVALHSACAMVSVPRMPSRTRSDCPKTKKIKAIEPQPALKLYRLYRLYRLSASDGHQP